MLDESDSFRLFNLLNINYIKIPLIIEFVILSLAVLLFIGNYGYFQIQQVQRPIEILIQFLKKSLQQQHQSQKQMFTKKDDKLTNISNKLTSRKRNISYFYSNNASRVKNDEQAITLFSPSHVAETPIQTTYNNLHVNLNVWSCNDRNIDQQKTIQLLSKNNLLSRFNVEEGPNIIDQLDSFATKNKRIRYYSQQNPRMNSTKYSNQALHNFESINELGNQPKSNLTRSLKNNLDSQLIIRNTSQSQVSQDKNKEPEKEKILQGLKPLFLEMKIIKEAFQNLEKLINYEIDSNNHNSQDTMNTLYHFAKAKNTFQRLQNGNGLSRCYFNLGIINVIKNEYNIASQYFESSVQLNLALLGIDSLKQIQNNCTLNFERDQDDWLLIFSKRIFSLAYSYKQQAFEMACNKAEKHTKNYSQKINFQQKNDDHHVSQIQKIRSILKKALGVFKVVQILFNYNHKCYSEIFQAFVYQEIIEILIYLDQKYFTKQIQTYFNKINYLMNKIQIQKSKINLKILTLNDYKLSEDTQNLIQEEDFEQFSNQNLSNNSHQEIKCNMIDVMNSRQKFLQGYLEQARNNYVESIKYFTQSLEDGMNYSPYLRKKTMLNIIKLLEKLSISQDFIDEQILNLENYPHLDLTLLLQIDSISNNSTFDNCVETLVKFKLLQPKDRIKVIVFNESLDELIPFTVIQSYHHANLMISTVQSIAKHQLLYYKKTNININSLSWKQALIESLQNIQELNNQQKIDLNSIFKEMKSNMNEESSYEKIIQIKKEIKQLNHSKQNKKVIILFSKQQNAQQKLTIKQNILQLQKPIVFHITSDSYISEYQDEEEEQIKSKLFLYETLTDETQLMFCLKKIRGEENNNHYKEFFTILNYF